MTTGDRMRNRRKQLGFSAEYIAKQLKCSPATIYRYENGDIGKIPVDSITPIAQVLLTTPSYLMGWDDDSSPDSVAPSNLIPLPRMDSIPLLGAIACGSPILAEENVEAILAKPEHIAADFCLRCRGDSMINARIFDGDIVYIRSQPQVEDGEIAAVLIGDEATLKRVRLFPDHVSLEPENPQYRPLVYWGADMEAVRILGKAVAFTSAVR